MQKNRPLLLVILLLISAPALHSQAVSWYKTFSATIDTYPITIHLHRAGEVYSGFYYYDRIQQPVTLTGDDTTGQKQRITLLAYIPGEQDGETENFELQISGDSIWGEWRPGIEKTPKPVRGKVKAWQGTTFDYIFARGAEKLRSTLANSPEWSYYAATVWPAGNSATDQFLKKTISRLFGAKASGQPVGTILLSQKRASLADYRKEFGSLPDSDLVQFPSGYTQSEDHTLQVVYRSKRFISLADFNYAFTGGAHGNYSTGYSVIDLAKNKILDLKDVLTPAGIKQANVLLARNFRKKTKIKPTDPLTEGGLFEDSISVTENFYMTGKGIGFSYSPYEIAPYALGEILVFVSFADLEKYLQPAFLAARAEW